MTTKSTPTAAAVIAEADGRLPSPFVIKSCIAERMAGQYTHDGFQVEPPSVATRIACPYCEGVVIRYPGLGVNRAVTDSEGGVFVAVRMPETHAALKCRECRAVFSMPLDELASHV